MTSAASFSPRYFRKGCLLWIGSLALSLSAPASLAQSAPLPVLKTLQQLALTGQPSVSNLGVLSDGRRVLCAGEQVSVFPAVPVRGMPSQPAFLLPTGECQHWSLSADSKWLALWKAEQREVQLWSMTFNTGQPYKRIPVEQWRGMGFVSGQLWLLTEKDLLAVDLNTGESRPVDRPSNAALPRAFFASASGKQAVIQREGRVQLVRLPSFEVVSGLICENQPCKLTDARFSNDGKRAIVFVDQKLHGLREQYPSTTLLKNAKSALGFPLSNNTALVFENNMLTVRDAQTGRREMVLLNGVQPPAALSGDLLTMLSAGQLLTISVTSNQETQRLPLFGPIWKAGLNNKNQPVLLQQDGTLQVADQVVTGRYQDLATRNRLSWILGDNAQATLHVLQEGILKALPSMGGATRVAVNHWGTTGVLWNAEGFCVVSLEQQKKLFEGRWPNGPLADAEVTLSPDNQRLFVFAAGREPFMLSFTPSGTPEATPLAGLFTEKNPLADLQINNLGTMALLVRPSEGQPYVALYAAKETKPYALLAGAGKGSSFSQDGLWLAVPVRTPEGLRVQVLEVRTGNVLAQTPLLNDWPSVLSWSADRTQLLVGAGSLGTVAGMSIFGF